MRLLGAILAGGQSRRFGSDKAHALLDGKRLIDHVADALAKQCEAVVFCGRDEPGLASIPDQPEGGHGPLAGLNAALLHAQANGFDQVLSSGCDIPNLPPDLAAQLDGEGAAYAADQPVVGLWPASLQPLLGSYLCGGGRALFGFADLAGARAVAVAPPLANINTPQDLPRAG
ncbi:molybdenum cofactor guanylyltransferase [Parerythrobacter aestuarii]|uniref:molybdenum cofactor guanylyltransferase n=1 Tax=Parerythrobacter aestuarii TaxID=3020909 RepID=UPI0024DE9636|nr:molybdenum cofactor guanylyltransferase [Parerythrobacter aestuarii]